MKAIYHNKIFDISSVSEPDEHNNFILLLSSETDEVKVTAIAYQYYEYEFQPSADVRIYQTVINTEI